MSERADKRAEAIEKIAENFRGKRIPNETIMPDSKPVNGE